MITRWPFGDPLVLLESFDYTVCKAVVWVDGGKWKSAIDPAFYPDLAAKRLTYTHPARNEDAGGSLMRMRKFVARGYNIQPLSIAGVVARLVIGAGKVDGLTEVELTGKLDKLLLEVDPNVVLDGVDIVDEHKDRRIQ
jgi:hypothetical protein